jgi:ribosomal protein S18 acetylase RimI-like enzyme
VPTEEVEFPPTIDRAWLDREAARDPIAHAYALWDLAQHPGRIRVISAVVAGRTLGYLLVWFGRPEVPVVHWVGSDPRLATLASRLPDRPLVAIVPELFRAAVAELRGPVVEVPLLALLAADPSAGTVAPPGVRRLVGADREALAAWAAGQEDPVVVEYAHLDPETEMLWGAFDDERIVGVVRAAVRLPAIWILGGVYVEPAARGNGLGRALVATALGAARDEHAALALYVREDRPPARGLYASLGFRAVGRRYWLDAGSGLVP